MPRLPPGAPGGGMTGVLFDPTLGGACAMSGSTPRGGRMTPPERSSLSLSGSVELPLVARSSGTVCDDDGPVPWSLVGSGAAEAAADPVSNRARPATKTDWRILGIVIASSLPTESGAAAFLGLLLAEAW